MAEYLIRQIRHTDDVDVALEQTVTAVHGPDQLEALDVWDARPGVARRVETSALFLLIGADPDTGCLDGALARDGAGYLLTGAQLAAPGRRPTWPLERAPSMLETSIPGDFAVGAVRHRSVKPVASVVGEGASAIQFVHKYLGDGDARAPS